VSAAQAPQSRTDTDGRAADRLTAHQRRIVSRRDAYCRALARANRALTYEDCEDVFAETLARDALGLPATLSRREAHLWFSRRLQQRAIDFIRRRDGRRESEKERRLRVVSLDAPTSDDGEITLEGALADPNADVAGVVEAQVEAEQAIAAAERALQRLKPLEQRLLKLRYELPDLSVPELAAMVGLTADQAHYRLRTAATRFRQALAAGRFGPECDVARGTLRSERASADPVAWARAEAHVAGCWMCRAWQLQQAALAWLPFPAFTKLEWLIARTESKWRPFAPLPETAAGAGAAGGATLLGGAGAKLAAWCGATVVTAAVCATVAGVLDSETAPPLREPAAEARPRQTPDPRVTPTPTPTVAPKPRLASAKPAKAKRSNVEADTRSAERARPAAAPAGSEFEPTAGGSTASTPPAPAPAVGGTEFTP
jgi:RNA polymerase sigma factor (sigma-70 family)